MAGAGAWRFIPARAGNTTGHFALQHQAPVHPRPRGEHGHPRLFTYRVQGSSPPARGTRQQCDPRDRSVRFIPARAGNTLNFGATRSHTSVHPRPRGEHVGRDHQPGYRVGSSPPARGTPGQPGPRHVAIRFIPARAGNTPLEADPARLGAVHPRPRGEHQVVAYRRREVARFIPARAGNTVARRPSACRIAVHPRPRGEHILRVVLLLAQRGSSPPARGTPQFLSPLSHAVRFIPARAGNTTRAGLMSVLIAVHPRPRGEHPTPWAPMQVASGSSPPARGTLGPKSGIGALLRFIPARAGNTPRSPGRHPTRPVHPRPRGEHATT